MISSILLLGGIGFLAALILGVSAVTFAVKMDPREQAVLEHLPGANCGACGYAGCAAFAHEITTNAEAEMACPAVNEEALQAISEVLGRTCLLYTSDAADDLLCGDPGGRRIIKKKRNSTMKTT